MKRSRSAFGAARWAAIGWVTLLGVAGAVVTPGCGRAVLNCPWRSQAIVVDGRTGDWSGTWYSFADDRIVMSVTNDGEFLYLGLAPSEMGAQAQITDGGNGRERMPVSEARGIEVRAGFSEEQLACEFKIPLRADLEHPFAAGTIAGQALGIGVEVPGFDRGGPEGGGMRGGAGHGGGRGPQGSSGPIEFWIRVRPATRTTAP